MLKLDVGISKKVGEANYGSRGASVNLELELDSGIFGDPDRLKERIRQLFVLATACVDEELNGHAQATNGRSGAATNGNGRQRDATRKATASQVRALHAIAQRQHLDATNVVQSRYGLDTPEDLSITEARAELDEAVEKLDEHYGELRSAARQRLGRLFNPADYPQSLRGLVSGSRSWRLLVALDRMEAQWLLPPDCRQLDERQNVGCW